MKKILFVSSLILATILLVACLGKGKNHGVYITKYYETYSYDTAIEIYNSTDKSVDLSDYAIDIYSNGDTEVTYQVKLEGELESENFYLITYDDLDSAELEAAADMKSRDLIYNGDDAVALSYKGKIVDIIGEIGSSMEFGKDVTLVKKLERQQAFAKYNPYDYIRYKAEAYDYLKTSEGILTTEELINGPKFDESTLALPFTIGNGSTKVGGGGSIEVTVASIADGDTITVTDKVTSEQFRIRYYYVDTREVIGSGSPTGQAWGYQASRFNKEILNDAKNKNIPIRIQSIKDQASTDMYDRYFGLVWVGDRCLNFELARAGMSSISLGTISKTEQDTNYKDVPITSFLSNAGIRATLNGWGVNGIDPYYVDGKSTITNTNDPKLDVDPREFDPKIDK